jgi:hypothetical protein
VIRADFAWGSVGDLSDGLVLYYNFNTDSGRVSDDSGNEHTGTVYGATWVSDGVWGGAYRFDGVDDYIKATGYKGVLGSTPFTVSAWVKLMSFTVPEDNRHEIVSWGSVAGGPSCFYVDVYQQKVRTQW